MFEFFLFLVKEWVEGKSSGLCREGLAPVWETNLICHLQLKITKKVKCFQKTTIEIGRREKFSSFWEIGITKDLFASGQMGTSVLRV